MSKLPDNFTERDFAAARDSLGTLILHRADCPDVHQQAADGIPVMTLLGCDPERVRRADLAYHSCLLP